MKYYHTTNATVARAGIWFHPYGVYGGAQFGVYATDNADEQVKLDALVDQNLGVTATTEEDFSKAEKKTPRKAAVSIVSDGMQNPLTKELPLKGKGAVVVDGNSTPTAVAEPDKPAELIAVGVPSKPRRQRGGGASSGE